LQAKKRFASIIYTVNEQADEVLTRWRQQKGAISWVDSQD